MKVITHRVKVKVTAAEKDRKCLFMHCSTTGNFHRYSPDGAAGGRALDYYAIIMINDGG